MEINWNCHGAGLVEIKCPATIIDKIPSIENYSTHIEKDGDNLKLKSTSSITGRFKGNLLHLAVYNVTCLFFHLKETWQFVWYTMIYIEKDFCQVYDGFGE